MPKLATGHHFFRTRKATPRIRAAAATATPPATSIGVKFSKGQGPRPLGPPLGASPSSAPSPGPLGSGATSGVLGAAGAGFRLLWLLRRAGSALAGVFLAGGGVGAAGGSCFSAWASFFPGLEDGAFPSMAAGARASAVALVSALGLLVGFPLDSMLGVWAGCAGYAGAGRRLDHSSSGQFTPGHPMDLGGKPNETGVLTSAETRSALWTLLSRGSASNWPQPHPEKPLRAHRQVPWAPFGLGCWDETC